MGLGDIQTLRESAREFDYADNRSEFDLPVTLLTDVGIAGFILLRLIDMTDKLLFSIGIYFISSLFIQFVQQTFPRNTALVVLLLSFMSLINQILMLNA